MHNSELYGRVLRVNYAQPIKIKGGDKGWSHQPVWADADKYIEELEAEKVRDSSADSVLVCFEQLCIRLCGGRRRHSH
jgi:peptidyl-prolyl isomerase E (cyclophilin E)